MSKRRMIIFWLASSIILTLLFTLVLGVLGRISLIEYTVLFLGWLLVIAILGLFFRIFRRRGTK